MQMLGWGMLLSLETMSIIPRQIRIVYAYAKGEDSARWTFWVRLTRAR